MKIALDYHEKDNRPFLSLHFNYHSGWQSISDFRSSESGDRPGEKFA